MLDHVLSPFHINGVALRNRVVRTSQGTGLGKDRQVSDDSIAFFTTQARGGVALAFADPGQIHWSSPGLLDLSTPECIPGLRRLTDAVHSEGMAMFQQIWHGGPTQMTLDSSAPWSASHVPDPGLGMLPIPMTHSMIEELTDCFVTATLQAREGGIDGVEFHAGHGYLFSAFLSPATNVRDDEYGGDLRNRSRFLRDVIRTVRAEVGPDYPIGIRVSPDGPADQTTIGDVGQVVAWLEADGLIDFVDLSLGSHYRRDLAIAGAHERPGYQLPSSEKVSRTSSLPTIVTGRFLTLRHADDVIASGGADLVSMVRATLAEPDLVTKTISGRTAEIRTCIACLQSCAGGLNTRGRAMCTINPSSGRELTHGDQTIQPTARTLDIIVVGGGPAGMEAARSTAIAGHRVVLLEASGVLGGQLRLVPPTRSEVAQLVDFYTNEMTLHGIDVRLATTVTARDIHAAGPDAVIIATGATPRTDGFQSLRPALPLPGLADTRFHTGWDVLGGKELGHTVVLIDEIGHYESLDVALQLVNNGHHVHHITRYATVGANLEMRWEMIGAPIYAALLRGEFTLHPRSVLLRVAPGVATIAPHEAPQRAQQVLFDDLVLMSGSIPDRSLQSDLAEDGPLVRVIGDANSPRRLEIALVEARQSVKTLSPDWSPSPAGYGWAGSTT